MTYRLSLPALVAAATLGAAGLSGLATPASAGVWVQLKETGYTPVEQSGSNTAGFSVNYVYHDYKFSAVSAQDQYDLNFSTFQLGKTAANSNNLVITVSATGLTDPATVANFTASFTKNGVLTAGWKIDMATYYDPSDTKYKTTGIGVLKIGEASFVSTGAFSDNNTILLTPSHVPYTITTVYTVTSPSKGSASASAVVDAEAIVPEPASLAILGAALAGFGIVGRRRNKIN